MSSCPHCTLVAPSFSAHYDAIPDKTGAAYPDVAHEGVGPDREDLPVGEQCIRFSRQQRDMHGGAQHVLW